MDNCRFQSLAEEPRCTAPKYQQHVVWNCASSKPTGLRQDDEKTVKAGKYKHLYDRSNKPLQKQQRDTQTQQETEMKLMVHMSTWDRSFDALDSFIMVR